MEAAIRPYKLMVRPALATLSKGAELMGVTGMDADEKAGGEFAYGGWMYQEGGKLDFRFTALLFTASFVGTRTIEWLEKRNRERKSREAGTKDMGSLKRVDPPKETP